METKCIYTDCQKDATIEATLRVGNRRTIHTCDDHEPGKKRPHDAPWPMCYDIKRIAR